MSPLLTSMCRLCERQEPTAYTFLWAGISAIATVIGRNGSLQFGNGRIYPNLYIMFVGDAGRRKSTAIKDFKRRVEAIGYTDICGDKVTMEKYLSDLADGNSDTSDFSLSTELREYVESYICQDEFSDFIGINNYPFVALLGNLWDIDTDYKHRMKNSKSVEIKRPLVNFIGATTPSQFHTIFPPSIGEQGFISRLLIIHVPKSLVREAFPGPSCAILSKQVADTLIDIRANLVGDAVLTPTAKDALRSIYDTWQPLRSIKFEHYSTRRYTQLLKLCIVMAASRMSLEISEADVVLANTVLSQAELYMPIALGSYGKHRDSDVADKIVKYITTRAGQIVTSEEIIALVAAEVDLLTCSRLLESLIAGGRIQRVANRGFLAVAITRSDIKTSHIDWSLIDPILEDAEF